MFIRTVLSTHLLKTYTTALKVAFTLMFLGLALFKAFPSQLLMLFDASEEMLRIGVPALRLISLCFPFAAFGIITAQNHQPLF